MIPGITVLIPTIGRDSLGDCIESVVSQLGTNDRCIVAFDGVTDKSPLYLEFLGRVFFLYREQQLGDYGHPLRNHLLDKHVRTSHVWSIDDDDVARPGALQAMRNNFDQPWVIFAMHFGPGHPANGLTLPLSQRIIHGNVGTPMIFAPVSKARFGHHYAGDLDYATELEQLFGPPSWRTDIVATIRP